MDSRKRRHKHPYIEVSESCIKCSSPVPSDCLIGTAETPFCSNYCKSLHHLDKYREKIKLNHQDSDPISDIRKLTSYADSLLVLVVISFMAYFQFSYKLELEPRHMEAYSKWRPSPVLIAKKDIKLTSPKPSAKKTGPPVKVIAARKKSAQKTAKKISPAKKSLKRVKTAASISRVYGAGKRLSLTFDGGSNNSSAREILNVLSEKGIKTTFFLTGRFIENYPDIVLRIINEGHEVGNHTYRHPHLTRISFDGTKRTGKRVSSAYLKKELEDTARAFMELTGEDMSPIWRAPYGEINSEILTWAFESGYRHIGWTYDPEKRQSMDSLDWVADKSSSLYLTGDEIKERLLAFADEDERASGGIALMHLGTERSDDIAHEKLDEIIDSFIEMGYEIVSISELLMERG